MQSCAKSSALGRTLALGAACRAPSHATARHAAARHASGATAASLLRRSHGRPLPSPPTSSTTARLPLLLRGRHQQQQPRLRPLSLTRSGHTSASPPGAQPQKTPLYDLHVARGGKMVPYGGFHMPVQYADQTVGESHLFTRAHASLFDVGHMAQRVFSGPGAAAFLQRLTPCAAAALAEHRSSLTCFMASSGSGGVVDDAVVTRLPGGRFYVVTNAACREKDDAYLDEEARKWNADPRHGDLQVREQRLDGQGLVALQGPEAEAVLAAVLAEEAAEEGEEAEEGQQTGGLDLKQLLFGHSAYARLRVRGGDRLTAPVLVSRGGYTGEDGFEISVAGEETADVAEALLAAGGPERVRLAGLGARDSLRLEAGMCLYGHELDEDTTPVQAGLAWIIPKERRHRDAGFYGAEVIAAQLTPKSAGGSGVGRRRVGLVVEGAPARDGARIGVRSGDGVVTDLGAVTSGCPSPSLGKNIAMGYVADGYHKAGTEVDVQVRGKWRKAVVVKMPFVPTKYWKGGA